MVPQGLVLGMLNKTYRQRYRQVSSCHRFDRGRPMRRAATRVLYGPNNACNAPVLIRLAGKGRSFK